MARGKVKVNIEAIAGAFIQRINESNDPKYLDEIRREIGDSRLNKKDRAYLYTEVELRKYGLSPNGQPPR